jgi:hypothetical protein
VRSREGRGGGWDRRGPVDHVVLCRDETWLGWEEEDVPGPDVRGVCVVILLFRETRCALWLEEEVASSFQIRAQEGSGFPGRKGIVGLAGGVD